MPLFRHTDMEHASIWLPLMLRQMMGNGEHYYSPNQEGGAQHSAGQTRATA